VKKRSHPLSPKTVESSGILKRRRVLRATGGRVVAAPQNGQTRYDADDDNVPPGHGDAEKRRRALPAGGMEIANRILACQRLARSDNNPATASWSFQ
jgi:hypothetical protein